MLFVRWRGHIVIAERSGNSRELVTLRLPNGVGEDYESLGARRSFPGAFWWLPQAPVAEVEFLSASYGGTEVHAWGQLPDGSGFIVLARYSDVDPAITHVIPAGPDHRRQLRALMMENGWAWDEGYWRREVKLDDPALQFTTAPPPDRYR